MFGKRLSMLAALAGGMLASTAALAQISDDIVKIGVLTDMNGPTSTPTGQGCSADGDRRFRRQGVGQADLGGRR